MLIAGQSIVRVSIVDDSPEARRAYGYTVADADLVPVDVAGPLIDVDGSLRSIAAVSDALLCDHHLRKRNYADFDGAPLVAAANRAGRPAILCSSYERPDIVQIRRFRRHIPVLLRGETLDATSVVDALEHVLREFAEGPGPERRLWRAQVHVVDAGEPGRGTLFARVPAWGDELIGVAYDDVPPSLRSRVGEDSRLYAHVNLGAESSDQLFFEDWEVTER